MAQLLHKKTPTMSTGMTCRDYLVVFSAIALER